MTDTIEDFLQRYHFAGNQIPFVEELTKKEFREENNSLDECSSVSVEEEIPGHFNRAEALQFKQEGFVPPSILRDLLFHEFSKEEKEDRNKLLLFYSLYESGKVPDTESLAPIKEKFREMERKVLWRFYKMVIPSEDTEKEFEELILDKIFQSGKSELIPYHFKYFSKSGVGNWDCKDFWNQINMLEGDYEKHKKAYCEILHSVFFEYFD